MTKSTITRERLEQLADNNTICKVSWDERIELAQIALAAMDSEPVAFTEKHEISNMHATGLYLRAWPADRARNAVEGYTIPLYRHAQPASVVPKSISVRQAISALESADAVTTIGQAYKMGWNACRAAMLQELQKSAGAEVICRSNENVQAINTIKATPALGSFPKTGEVQNTNPPEKRGCWCCTCRPVVLNDMRFVVCPDCGNKRCPRANDHRNACTGSNEPGQEGIAYPDTQQSPGSEPATVPGKWIPVSEEMPEREVDVQVYCPDKKEQMVAYLERNELEGYFRFATWSTGEGIYCQPTHWMQLPAGPLEVKGE
ncbi:DUF551 domain-containing protein [Klebsiella pneumoniae]|nr:DUF551 domain-containing protein [Klebsiella pneumoniae]